jgi:hypothetical protein
MRICRWVVAAALAAAAAAAVPSAGVAEPPAGSRNFNPPVAVPNYFSNESGPVLGTPATRPVQPAPVPVVAAPTSAPRPQPVVASGRKAERHMRKTAKSRDRSHAIQAKTRAADQRKTVAAGSARNAKASTRAAARNDKPRLVKLAHAEAHAAKAQPAAAKGQRIRAAEKRAGRG